MQYPGATVKVRLNGNLNGRRNFVGTFQEVISTQEATTVVIKVGSEEFRLPFQLIELTGALGRLSEAVAFELLDHKL